MSPATFLCSEENTDEFPNAMNDILSVPYGTGGPWKEEIMVRGRSSFLLQRLEQMRVDVDTALNMEDTRYQNRVQALQQSISEVFAPSIEGFHHVRHCFCRCMATDV